MAEAKQTSNEPEMKGWLHKWTNYIKGYQKRWFVLSNGVLSYYRYLGIQNFISCCLCFIFVCCLLLREETRPRWRTPAEVPYACRGLSYTQRIHAILSFPMPEPTLSTCGQPQKLNGSAGLPPWSWPRLNQLKQVTLVITVWFSISFLIHVLNDSVL